MEQLTQSSGKNVGADENLAASVRHWYLFDPQYLLAPIWKLVTGAVTSMRPIHVAPRKYRKHCYRLRLRMPSKNTCGYAMKGQLMVASVEATGVCQQVSPRGPHYNGNLNLPVSTCHDATRLLPPLFPFST
ncbi:hypothetical protein E2C01_034364 [Portunus trituberculatus]|uniref:Uncharacterized protein n=1 Tax=Portunus trituberculatus TaxID=210409 RepID=A0A5B7F615_PORTR|nr:hypothetical protein [Portunus trituberculatus]